LAALAALAAALITIGAPVAPVALRFGACGPIPALGPVVVGIRSKSKKRIALYSLYSLGCGGAGKKIK
jgi:hypothetical protein